MSDKDPEAAAKRGSAKADKGSKKAKKSKSGTGVAGDGPSVAAHPRAAAQVRRAKGWGGIGGFAIAAFLGSKAGIPPDQIGERALEAGIAGYLLAWACSVAVWRHLMMAELRALADRTLAAAESKRTIALKPTDEPTPDQAS